MTKSMMRLVAALLTGLLVTSCYEQEELAPKIIGQWSSQFSDGLVYEIRQMAFTMDGKQCVLDTKYSYRGASNTDYHLYSWQLTNGSLNSLLIASTSSQEQPNKTRLLVNKLTHAELQLMTTQNERFDVTKPITFNRLSSEHAMSLCLIVDGAIRKHKRQQQLNQPRL